MKYSAQLLSLGFATLGLAAEIVLPPSINVGEREARLELDWKAGDRAITGLQFDLEYDSEIFTARIAKAGASEASGKSLHQGRLGADRIRVVLAGLNSAPLEDGGIAVVHITLRTAKKQGHTSNLRITNVHATGKDAVSIRLPDTGTEVVIGDR